MGVVNLLFAGRAPSCIITFLCGASGGLRPIAIGKVLRRLISKCVARAVQSEAVSFLSPLQVGVGIPGGCEAIVHSLASLLNDCSIPPESRCTLLVDFSNAPLTVGSCLRRQGPGFLPCPHGWNVAMVPSLCYFWGNILSSVAVVSNKVILWVPWVLL